MSRWLYIGLALWAATPALANPLLSRDSNYNQNVAGGGVCAQATTFLARTSGLSGTQSTAYQNLICGMVADGTWGLMDGLYVFATNSTTTANLNLVSTSFGLTAHGTATFTANSGYTGDATAAYFDSGFNPNTAGGNWAQNSTSLGSCVLNSRTASQGYATLGAAFNAFAYIQPQFSGTGSSFELGGNTFPTSTNANAQGSMIISRTTSAAIALYQNGTSIATPTDASLALSQINENVFILAYDNTGTPTSFTGDQVGYAFWGAGLNSTQVTNVYTRLHNYMSAVGAAAC